MLNPKSEILDRKGEKQISSELSYVYVYAVYAGAVSPNPSPLVVLNG